MKFQKSKVVSVGGRSGSGKPTVSVSDNGRIQFSTAAAKGLNGHTGVDVDFNEKTRVVTFTGVAYDEASDSQVRLARGKEGKGKQVGIAGTGLLTFIAQVAPGYNYKLAGTQVFEAKTAGNKIAFTLPAETPAPRPKAQRAPRKPKTPVSVPAPEAPAAPGEFVTA